MALKLRAKVPFPASVSGTGGIKVVKDSGDWVISPDFAALAALTGDAVSDPTLKQIWIFDPSLGQYNLLTLAALGDALYKLTSTTSLSIGTGSKTFATQSGKDISVGSWVWIGSDAASNTNYMVGQVTSYSLGSLVVNVLYSAGSGTHTDWTIRASSPNGAQGKSFGFAYGWLTDTTSSDPTAGNIKANNATFASITSIYISETDQDANALASEIATWGTGTSTVKGRLKIYDPITPTNFMTFDVTALTDNGAWDTLTVTPIAHGGSFSASENLRVGFVSKGDKGDTGATGAAGSNGTTAISGTPTVNQLATFHDASTIQGVSITGLVKGNGASAPAAAVAGTDYLAPAAIGTTVQAFDAQLFSNVPQVSVSAAHTTVLTEGEKCLFHPAADTTARTWTIDSNANVAYPVGTVIGFAGESSSGVITLAITADTLVWLPSGSTGSRTLTAPFLCAAMKVTATKWFLVGQGIT